MATAATQNIPRTDFYTTDPGDLPIGVGDINRLIDRMLRRIPPLKYIRELTRNGIEAVQRAVASGSLQHGSGLVIWTYDPEYAARGALKLMNMDNGDGMTALQVTTYMNQFSSSISFTQGGPTANHGMGGKMAGIARGSCGLHIRSWQDGEGCEAILHRNASSGVIGLKALPYNGGYVYVRPLPRMHICQTEPIRGRRVITTHGTTVTVLGDTMGENTLQTPVGAPSPQRWIMRDLNSQLMRVDSALTLWAISDVVAGVAAGPAGSVAPKFHPKSLPHHRFRKVHGQYHYMQQYSVNRNMPDRLVKILYPNRNPGPDLKMPNGVVTIDRVGLKAKVYWYLLDIGARDKNVEKKKRKKGDSYRSKRGSTHFELGQHVGLVYQDEIYELYHGQAKLSQFGAYTRPPDNTAIAMLVELDDSMNARPTDERTTLTLPNGRPVPWDDLAREFNRQFPAELNTVLRHVAEKNVEKSKAIDNFLDSYLFKRRIAGFRAAKDGAIDADKDSEVPLLPSGVVQLRDTPLPPTPPKKSGDKISETRPDHGDDRVYERKADDKTPKKKRVQTKKTTSGANYPKVEFVTAKQREDLRDFPGVYEPGPHLIVINEDYAITRDFVRRFTAVYTRVYPNRQRDLEEKVRSVVRAHVKAYLSGYVMGNLRNMVPTNVAEPYGVDRMSWASPLVFHFSYQAAMEGIRQNIEKHLKADMPSFGGHVRKAVAAVDDD